MDAKAQTIESYMHQWLKTASGGRVKVIFATQTDRMTLYCDKCDQSLTAQIPATPYMSDFGVQQFVKLHAHNGTYDKGKDDTQSWKPQIAKMSDANLSHKIASLQLEAVKEKYSPKNWQATSQLKEKEAKEYFDEKAAKAEKYAKYTAEYTKKFGSWEIEKKAETKFVSGQNFTDSTGAEGVLVNGKRIYWKKDKRGNIVGVSDTPTAPVPVRKAPRESTGRKFR